MSTQAMQATPNHDTLADLMSTITELGVEAGKGKDTQIKTLLKLVEAGYHNVVDIDKNKHGAGVDDATKLAEAYVKAQTGATIFDAKAGNQRKTISCFRQVIKLGAWPKGGTGEPLATVNNLMTIRGNLRKTPGMAKKLKDAANTLIDYARVQCKRDQLVSEQELRAMCFKPDNEARDAEEHVEAARNALQKLYDGKASHGQAQDNSPEVRQAIHTLTQRLKDIAAEKRVDANSQQLHAVTTAAAV